jgi:hemerythrin-like domain-containing protein
MEAIDTLVQDHEFILTALRILEAQRQRLDQGGEVAPDAAGQLVGYLCGFADLHHHYKEEQILFPALGRAGMPPQRGPVGVMLHEHESGRALLRALAAAAPQLASSAQARRDYSDAAAQYASLLFHHIQKENNILFQMARALLPPAEQSAVDRACAEAELRAEQSGQRAAYDGALASLAREFLQPGQPG